MKQLTLFKTKKMNDFINENYENKQAAIKHVANVMALANYFEIDSKKIPREGKLINGKTIDISLTESTFVESKADFEKLFKLRYDKQLQKFPELSEKTFIKLEIQFVENLIKPFEGKPEFIHDTDIQKAHDFIDFMQNKASGQKQEPKSIAMIQSFESILTGKATINTIKKAINKFGITDKYNQCVIGKGSKNRGLIHIAIEALKDNKYIIESVSIFEATQSFCIWINTDYTKPSGSGRNNSRNEIKTFLSYFQ